MIHRHDMSKEKSKAEILPEGTRNFEITACENQVSKSGNEMFKFTVADSITFQEVEIYAIAIPGKRWFLKQILDACGIEAAQDGIYEWDTDAIIGKRITFDVSHEEEDWIGRDGNNRKVKKHRLNNPRVS